MNSRNYVTQQINHLKLTFPKMQFEYYCSDEYEFHYIRTNILKLVEGNKYKYDYDDAKDPYFLLEIIKDFKKRFEYGSIFFMSLEEDDYLGEKIPLNENLTVLDENNLISFSINHKEITEEIEMKHQQVLGDNNQIIPQKIVPTTAVPQVTYCTAA